MPTQNSLLFGNGCGSLDNGSVCGGDSYLTPHSAFESSSDRLIESATPNRGHTAHNNHLNPTGIFSSLSSTDGLSPTSR